MQIKFASISLADQDEALRIYTSVLLEDGCGNLIQPVQPSA